MIKVPENFISGKSFLPVLHMVTFSLHSHVTFLPGVHMKIRDGKREKEFSGVSSYKTINPIRSGPHPYDFI